MAERLGVRARIRARARSDSHTSISWPRLVGQSSDPGCLVSLPRFCYPLAALRRPETVRSITPITSDRIPFSQSLTHSENTTLSRPPIYLLNGPPSRTSIPLPTLPVHQCQPYNTCLLHPHMSCRSMRRYIRSVRRPLHGAESQPSSSGIEIGQLGCVPEQDTDRV